MCMLSLRTLFVGDGLGTQVRRGGSIGQQRNGSSDSEYGEPSSALTLAFPAHGRTIPLIFDITLLLIKSRWKIPEASPAALPEWSLTARRFQAPPTFR